MQPRIDDWMWTCPAIALVLAAAILWIWGLSWPSAIMASLLLACPLVLVWGARQLRRSDRFPAGVRPQTEGTTMGWAAPIYDWYCPKLGLGKAFRTETLRHAALQAGEHVLDVGCGTGVLTRLAAEAVGPAGTVIGIDAAPAMIAVARDKAAETGNRARFEVAAVETLPFADASFDVVLSSAMLHHLPPATKEAGLESVRRVLKSSGRLVIADLDRPASPLWRLLFWPLLAMPMTAANLRGEIPAFLRRSGFRSIQCPRTLDGLADILGRAPGIRHGRSIMKNAATRQVRQLFGALVLGGVMVSGFAASTGQRVTVSGIDIYYGMVPAQLAAKHPLSHEERSMHGGVKGAKDAYHLVVALFHADGKRITTADVRANIAELGMAGTNQKLEAMQIDGATSYGGYFVLSGEGPYRITVDARLPGAAAPIQATFDYTRN